MAVLKFTIEPEAISKLHDVLVCLGRFQESVCLEATRDKLFLSALNSTKTGYAQLSFVGDKFFTKYLYSPPRAHGRVIEKFTCRIYNKALLSVFKARPSDPTRERDTGIDKCEVTIEDGPQVKSRMIVQMTCRHGVLKTYHLTFEAATSMHAIFKSELTRNVWSMSSNQLAINASHFGPRTEQLDIYHENGKAVFTSYVEKVATEKQVLKQPLTTSISVNTAGFTRFQVEEMLHIIISVKDFKTIVNHASITDTEVTASYSHPTKPLQIKYGDDGLKCEFILMTLGDYRGGSTPVPTANRVENARITVQNQLQQQPSSGMRAPQSASSSRTHPPPATRPEASGIYVQPTPSARIPPTPASRLPPTQHSHLPQPLFDQDSESMFVPPGPDEEEEDLLDRRFDPTLHDDEDEMLGWDPQAVYEAHEPAPRVLQSSSRRPATQQDTSKDKGPSQTQQSRFAPTQRVSQVRGLFDDD